VWTPAPAVDDLGCCKAPNSNIELARSFSETGGFL